MKNRFFKSYYPAQTKQEFSRLMQKQGAARSKSVFVKSERAFGVWILLLWKLEPLIAHACEEDNIGVSFKVADIW